MVVESKDYEQHQDKKVTREHTAGMEPGDMKEKKEADGLILYHTDENVTISRGTGRSLFEVTTYHISAIWEVLINLLILIWYERNPPIP